MGFEHPLAYLLGIEGLALLRAAVGEADREFAAARFAEIRRLLDHAKLTDIDAGVPVERVRPDVGYRTWSSTYDTGDNALFEFDEPLVREIVDPLPAGVALDAACGTGRFTGYLASLGHRVIGVDGSPPMLERAREKDTNADLRVGDLDRLPVGDAEIDVAVCALALVHVPDLRPVMAEFARVLRPGGHLVVTDVHPERVFFGSVPKVRGPAGRPERIAVHRHRVGDYLRAALAAGLRVRRCEEPPAPPDPPSPVPSSTAEIPDDLELGRWEDWPWSLYGLVPAATQAASAAAPLTIVWHFQLDDPA